MIICNIIVIPRRKPRFQKEFIWRGQGYDCKWDFISNTKKWKVKNNSKKCRYLRDEREEFPRVILRDASFLFAPQKR